MCVSSSRKTFYKMCFWGDRGCHSVSLKRNRAQANSSFPPLFPDSRGLKPVQEDTPQLMRTRSDVGVRRRGNVRTSSDQRRIRRHRFSINGHYYNHKVEEKPRGHPYFLGIWHFSAMAMWSQGEEEAPRKPRIFSSV